MTNAAPPTLILFPTPPGWFANWNLVQVLASTRRFEPFLGVWWHEVYSWALFTGVTGAEERAGRKLGCSWLAERQTCSFISLLISGHLTLATCFDFWHGPQKLDENKSGDEASLIAFSQGRLKLMLPKGNHFCHHYGPEHPWPLGVSSAAVLDSERRCVLHIGQVRLKILSPKMGS